MGIANLEGADSISAEKRRNNLAYLGPLGEIRGCRFCHPTRAKVTTTSRSSRFPLLRGDRETGPSQTLHAENALAKRYIWPGWHRMKSPPGQSHGDLSARGRRGEDHRAAYRV